MKITVDEYINHVIYKLIGIYGSSHSEVINYIIKSWISDHWEELVNYDISIKRKDN